MPFEKRGNEYVSPSGKRYSKKQVQKYYATDGFKKKPKKKKRKPRKDKDTD